MSQLQLIDANKQVEQAQAVLSLWLEQSSDQASPALTSLIGAVLTLLHGVPQAMEEAESALAGYVIRDHREGKE